MDREGETNEEDREKSHGFRSPEVAEKNLRHQDSIWAYVVFSSYNISTAILQRFASNVLHLRLTFPRDLSKSASTFIRLVTPWLIGPELAGLMRPGLDLPRFATAGLRWTQGSRSFVFWNLGFKTVWFYRRFDPLLFWTLV